MNREVENTGLQMSASGEPFQISFLTDNNPNDGLFKTFHDLVKDPSAMYWQMTSANNMGNYNTSSNSESAKTGIKPGDSGVISFYITPTGEPVYVDINFEMLTYAYTNETSSSTTSVTSSSASSGTSSGTASGTTSVTSSGASSGTSSYSMVLFEKDKSPSIFMNGHILFFEEKKDDKYEKPILSDVAGKRVLHKHIKKETRIDVYWVWPNTLSKIVKATDCKTITVTDAPIVTINGDSSSDYQKIVSNVLIYPQYYMKGVVASDNLDALLIEKEYDKYGDLYDQADNDIGMQINYMLLKVNVERSTASSAGGE